jgi:hypothetical protein
MSLSRWRDSCIMSVARFRKRSTFAPSNAQGARMENEDFRFVRRYGGHSNFGSILRRSLVRKAEFAAYIPRGYGEHGTA